VVKGNILSCQLAIRIGLCVWKNITASHTSGRITSQGGKF